ncbi:HigA family addiction module antitoxin [Tepidanaerobacter acetatoxydans]|uniref:HigA family addiction module antitoxin n=1 Tax=Tepidanaerobacter acetatoxydans TaxID=499229 RepID=UPI001BD1D06D|nr:HigA family addiction module antitoxin [Tepidanaerobacter acetatoxydans]
MVNKKDNNDFMPTVAIPPRETIKENMEFLGMNQKELAARLNITPKHLSNIINGNAPITYDTALKLETVIGPSAQFWMNLETNYQLNKARLEKQAKLDRDLEILKEIPYKEMSEFGWVKETNDRIEKVFNCRNFFGVAELSSIKPSYVVAFRTHKQIREISDFGVLAWLRKAELEGLNVEVRKFNRRKLKSLIPTFRELTLKDPADFYPEMKRLCAECGVALVLVPYLPKTYVCGATIWRNNKAIIALSVRGKRADVFWFTFFHELAHLINHSSNEFHISFDNESEEDEANELASNYLISEEQYRNFIEGYDYTDKTQIVNYSHKIGIAPCILLGRLQHDNLIGYQYYNDLKPSFKIVNC